MHEVAQLTAVAGRHTLAVEQAARDRGHEPSRLLTRSVEEKHTPPRELDPRLRCKRARDEPRRMLARPVERPRPYRRDVLPQHARTLRPRGHRVPVVLGTVTRHHPPLPAVLAEQSQQLAAPP